MSILNYCEKPNVNIKNIAKPCDPRKKKYLKGVAITKNWSYLEKKKSLFLNVSNLYFKNIILAKSNLLRMEVTCVPNITFNVCVYIYIYIYMNKNILKINQFIE